MQHPDPHPLADLLPEARRLARYLSPSADRAEDLAQQALLNVWAQLCAGTEVGKLRPYLRAAIRNEARRPQHTHLPLDDAPEPSTPPEAPARLCCIEILAAIDTLPAAQAELLHLSLAETSYREMSDLLDLPQGTVTSRLARARAALRAKLDLPAEDAVSALLSE